MGDPSKIDVEDLAERLYKLNRREIDDNEYIDYDPSMLYMFTRDYMRIDVGVLFQRPPIFLHMRNRDKDFIIHRQNLMNEYFCNTKSFIDEFNEVSKLNVDVLSTIPYSSRMNIDNYPTHKIVDELTGEEKTYCAASKNWSMADPECTDNKSIHYAGEDRVYLILKNKYTGEWEFPIGTVYSN